MLGNDTDTTAAIAGGLAGTLYGEVALPIRWLATLRRREIVEGVVGQALTFLIAPAGLIYAACIRNGSREDRILIHKVPDYRTAVFWKTEGGLRVALCTLHEEHTRDDYCARSWHAVRLGLNVHGTCSNTSLEPGNTQK